MSGDRYEAILYWSKADDAKVATVPERPMARPGRSGSLRSRL